jgi:saccharopine dehydrogenase-like NADP-dependent oxidoreductase
MNVLVLGTGMMGSVLIRDLVDSKEISSVIIGDISKKKLNDLEKKYLMIK